MKRYIWLSLIATTLMRAGGDLKAVEPVVDVLESNEKLFGQIRGFYLDRTYSGTLDNNRNSLALGGWIGYESAELNGLSFGAKVYGTYGFDIHDEDADVIGASSYDPALYGQNFENYAFIGELYLNYAFNNTQIKIGRQKLDTPLIGADDARMLPNLFEAAVLSNEDIENTTLILAHVTKETVGTFGNIYAGKMFGVNSGYGLGMNDALSGDFVDMGVVALGEGNNTNGVTIGAVIYNGIDGLTLQAWDYYADDILNAVYLQADYGWKCILNPDLKMTASAQYINQSDVGNALADRVDSNYWSAKLGTSLGALSAYVAYSQTGDSDGFTNGGIITPWGGMPAFTQGMVTRHQFFADTESMKVAAAYKLNALTGLDISAAGYYATFDVGSENTYYNGISWRAKEVGFDFKYQATENLNLRFRGNFPNDFAPGLDWDEYRVIVNYNF